MSNQHAQHFLPSSPPPEALAELDAAARTLDELTSRAIELTIDMDEQSRSPRIQLHDRMGTRRLTPTQLLDLLAGV